MDFFRQIMDIVGYAGTAWLIISGTVIFIAWFKGILTPVWRLGNGLAKRKIAIFAKGDNKVSFKNLLLDSSLFNPKNIQIITKIEDFVRCESSALFLVVWDDFGNDISSILNKKSDKTALVIFSKPLQLLEKDWGVLDPHRNVTVVNFKGRLLNDMLVSLMVTGYDKK